MGTAISLDMVFGNLCTGGAGEFGDSIYNEFKFHPATIMVAQCVVHDVQL